MKEPPTNQPPTKKEVMPTLEAYTVEQVAGMLHIGRDKVYYLLRTPSYAASRSASPAASPASS